MSSDPSTDVDAALAELTDRIQQLRSKSLNRSSMRLARELKQRAKAEQRLIPYLTANFYIMNDAQSTLEPEVGVEAAIESIALLESEEQARQFQPDFPQAHYDYTVHWMSACSYDNLGTHVAMREGYNSEGVHSVLDDGIQVCRRTGKLECVNCFREYATGVFLAGGDLDMAFHHARTVATTPPRDETNDRRWVGARNIVDLLLVRGRLAEARAAAIEAFRLAPRYHNPADAFMSTRNRLEEILLLDGRPEELDKLCAEVGYPLKPGDLPPPGENTSHDLVCARIAAVRACCQANYDAAFDLLRDWDQRLTKLRCLSEWFEIRLRLVAVCALAGRTSEQQALAKQLEERAKAAGNWLTMQRLRGLLDGTVTLSPAAFLESPQTGPFAAAPNAGANAASDQTAGSAAPATTSTAAPTAARQTAPPTPFVLELLGKLTQSEGREEPVHEVHRAIVALPADQIATPDEAAWLLFLEEKVIQDGEEAAAAWSWAEKLAARFPQDGTVQNLFAWLGHVVRPHFGDDADTLIPLQRLEALMRASLDLEPERPKCHARAGWFYLAQGKNADAERCLARSFRLDRTNTETALSLAQLYSDSDRSQDALAVLELAIREGAEDPRIAWEAGLTASQLEQHEVALALFDRFESQNPDGTWAQYYRAWSLLALERPQEALAAVDLECSRGDGQTRIHTEILRACAVAQLGDRPEFCRKLAGIVSMRWADIDYLTEAGLARLLGKLYAAADSVAADTDDFQQLCDRLLASGLAPAELFEAERREADPAEGLTFYACLLRQPLDDTWPTSPGCLFGQERWNGYQATFGVLASGPDQATLEVLRWQARCAPLPAEVLACEEQSGPYNDSPGVVWQGVHLPLDE